MYIFYYMSGKPIEDLYICVKFFSLHMWLTVDKSETSLNVVKINLLLSSSDSLIQIPLTVICCHLSRFKRDINSNILLCVPSAIIKPGKPSINVYTIISISF